MGFQQGKSIFSLKNITEANAFTPGTDRLIHTRQPHNSYFVS
jgi:hypothetical protein